MTDDPDKDWSYVNDETGLRKYHITMIRLLASGMTRAQVGKHMGINEDTARSRFAKIRQITGAKNQAQLISWAYNEGHLLLAKERKPYKDIMASLQGERQRTRELAHKLRIAQERVTELEAALRAAEAQLKSVPWLTTNQGRL